MKKNYETPYIRVMQYEPRNILCSSDFEEIPIRNSKEDDSEFGDDEIYEWGDRI
ncbi:MAG: hypothetical protein KBS94_04140 [Prevotella sp.]|nr:hypothetical protein [Candidatus Equicola faecalis]